MTNDVFCCFSMAWMNGPMSKRLVPLFNTSWRSWQRTPCQRSRPHVREDWTRLARFRRAGASPSWRRCSGQFSSESSLKFGSTNRRRGRPRRAWTRGRLNRGSIASSRSLRGIGEYQALAGNPLLLVGLIAVNAPDCASSEQDAGHSKFGGDPYRDASRAAGDRSGRYPGTVRRHS